MAKSAEVCIGARRRAARGLRSAKCGADVLCLLIPARKWASRTLKTRAPGGV
jgi:hypothetical protein